MKVFLHDGVLIHVVMSEAVVRILILLTTPDIGCYSDHSAPLFECELFVVAVGVEAERADAFAKIGGRETLELLERRSFETHMSLCIEVVVANLSEDPTDEAKILDDVKR